jgi:hypothetical protein
MELERGVKLKKPGKAAEREPKAYGRFLGGKWLEHENRKSEIRKSENRKSIIY